MKLKLSIIIGVAVLGLATVSVKAKSNAPATMPPLPPITSQVSSSPSSPPSPAAEINGGLLAAGAAIFSDLQGATNWGIAPFAIYGLDTHKLGGGMLGLYDFNDYIASGAGIVYYGGFQSVSATAELKLPIKPLAFTGWSFATNLVVTPLAITSIGVPLGGSGTSAVTTTAGTGGAINLAKVIGGQLAIDGLWQTRSGAGKNSGKEIVGGLTLTWGNAAAQNALF